MGHTTNFTGEFKLSRELTFKEAKIINDFAEERHGGNLDVYAGFPGFWCRWITDGDNLYWDGSEKFYDYTEWLDYLIKNFFKPWGVVLSGKVHWSGEEPTDVGVIEIVDNVVSAYQAEFSKGKKIYG